MKPTVYAVIGLVMYGLQNAIIDIKLKGYSTVSLLVGFYLILLPLGLGLFLYQKYVGQPLVIPSGSAMMTVSAVAIMFFIADFFYIGAYTNGGNAIAITILAALVPVVVALVKFGVIREVPTPYHFGGFVLALMSVMLVAYGNSKKPIELGTGTAIAVEEPTLAK
ncbi:hypothetical protein KW796_00670 [Candidatus Parcubacteria bacterium]|nr:hypothetical protein [Candidatus Parcubacteria bacterium]